MDIFTCLLLSSQRCAYARIYSGHGVLARAQYVLQVLQTGQDTFVLTVSQVIYPGRDVPKEHREVRLGVPHQTLECTSKEELTHLLEEHNFNDLVWNPLEMHSALF